MTLQSSSRWITWSAALVALFVSGCGGEAGTPAEQAQPAARSSSQVASAAVEGYDCSALISESEIDGIIGMSGTSRVGAVRGDENQFIDGHTECSYELPQNNYLNVSVYTGGGMGEGLESFEVLWEDAQEGGATALPGMGEAALLHTDAAGPNVLVQVRGRGVSVGAGDFEGSDKLGLEEAIKRIATLVVGRV